MPSTMNTVWCDWMMTFTVFPFTGVNVKHVNDWMSADKSNNIKSMHVISKIRIIMGYSLFYSFHSVPFCFVSPPFHEGKVLRTNKKGWNGFIAVIFRPRPTPRHGQMAKGIIRGQLHRSWKAIFPDAKCGWNESVAVDGAGWKWGCSKIATHENYFTPSS